MAEYTDAFSPIFQYFVHLLNVSNNELAVDIDDLLKIHWYILCWIMNSKGTNS